MLQDVLAPLLEVAALRSGPFIWPAPDSAPSLPAASHTFLPLALSRGLLLLQLSPFSLPVMARIGVAAARREGGKGSWGFSTWAFGLNRQFGSVYSVAIKFGLQASPPDRFSKKLKTAKFGFGFLILVFGFSRINQKLLPPATTIQNYIKMNTSNSIYDIIDISNP